MKNDNDGIIFSKDVSFSYGVRSRCVENGIFLDYANSIEDLILYIIQNKRGFIFIDCKYMTRLTMLLEYIKSEKSNCFNFIFLTDNKEFSGDINDKVLVSNLLNIQETILKLKYISNAHRGNEDIPKSEIYKNIVEILESFRISPKYVGYTYLKECIAMGVESSTSITNFRNNIYPIIAQMYGTGVDAVDKNIRSAIVKAYEQNPQIFEKNDVCGKNITNVGFSNYIIEKVRLKCFESVD